MNYLPPVRCKSDYDGFYVDNSAIYVSKDDEKDWNCFLTQICRSIRKGYPSFQTRMCWKPSETGESIYVLMENPLFDLIADTGDKYTAVYFVVSNTCKNTGNARKYLPSYTDNLKAVLCELYPGHIRKRINERLAKLVG